MAMSPDFLKIHPKLQYFCTFVGYPKSGHSLVGALLDAHPDMVVAHEQDVLRCIKLGFPAETIYGLLINNSERFAHGGRIWRGYAYSVPHQWNGSIRELRVIGDKKGGGTTKWLTRDPGLLDEMMQVIPLQHKFIHVVRNPFDSISTLGRGDPRRQNDFIQKFARKWAIVAQFKAKLPPSDWYDIRHEQFVEDPQKWLKSLCDFLGQEAPGDYLKDCATIVKPMPHKSRIETQWPVDAIKKMEENMKPYSFLEGYSFES